MKTSTQAVLAFVALGLIVVYCLHNKYQAPNLPAVKVGTMSSVVSPHGDLVVTITGAGQAECLRAVMGAATKDDVTHTFVINDKGYDFPPWGFVRPIWDACDNTTNDIRITETKRATAPQHRQPSPNPVFTGGPGWIEIDLKNKSKDKCMAAIVAIARQEGMDLEVAVDGVKGHVDHTDPMKVAQGLCDHKSKQIVFTLGASPLPAIPNAN